MQPVATEEQIALPITDEPRLLKDREEVLKRIRRRKWTPELGEAMLAFDLKLVERTGVE